MLPSKVADYKTWPIVLRESQWRKALGPVLCVTVRDTHVGPTMEEAFKRFQCIGWKRYDELGEPEKQKEYYDKWIGPLVGALVSLRDYARLAAKRSKNSKLTRATNEVVCSVNELVERYRALKKASPHTPRTREKLNSGRSTADPAGSHSHGESSGQNSEKGLNHPKIDRWNKYKKCSTLEPELTLGYYQGYINGRHKGISKALEQIERAYLHIQWREYQHLVEKGDVDNLRIFYKDNIDDYYSLFVRMVDIADTYHGLYSREEEPRNELFILYFRDLKKVATERVNLYNGIPGSKYTRKWERDFDIPLKVKQD